MDDAENRGALATCWALGASCASDPSICPTLSLTSRDPQATAILPALPAGQGLTPTAARPLLPRGLCL
ncbi:hypothetical protein Celaphus_00006460 [Cervus elaphus hippelaphus]|uniref:Uncharacterized protein n=1 Tax=Cervus elaphus hippelaphus TaxID=46360 RepID=A0A212CUB6_CEREH|nr:hypothetical protein Celaphus_00006460 [Cervus elaphus hippelaphus]